VLFKDFCVILQLKFLTEYMHIIMRKSFLLLFALLSISLSIPAQDKKLKKIEG
jgi:hypothetical protein